MTSRTNFATTFILLVSCTKFMFCRDRTLESGHLKPFGFGKRAPVEEVDRFPEPSEFFKKYVWPLKPVKMIGAAKISKAFEKWTDDYFLSLEGLDLDKVTVETRKKENREQEVISLSFLNFVRTYNHTDNYMVNTVPALLRPDIVVPCSLQCSDIVNNNLVEDVMWFSSGGTKSVVHYDAVDNINCLYRGEKELFFVDPALYGDKVDIDKPEGAYSSMDVDSVDFTKFPGMADVEYYHVTLSAGDCLYIPYKWIHQVRSYGSNLAVNIWWKHHMSEYLSFEQCNIPCNPDFTLMEAEFGGFEQTMLDPDEIKSYLQGLFTNNKPINLKQLMRPLLGSEYMKLLKSSRKTDLVDLCQQIFTLLDSDKNKLVSKEEVNRADTGVYLQLSDKFKALEKVVEMMYDEINMDGDEEDEDIDRAADRTKDEL